jgi:hypothetical protein
MNIKTYITISLLMLNCLVFSQKQNNNSKINRPARIMVIPKKRIIVDGEISLSGQQQKVLTSLKKLLEDNGYQTIGFESVYERLKEDEMIQNNDNSRTRAEDVTQKILKASDAEFYLMFENIDEKSNVGKISDDIACLQDFELKIKNYASGEDVASDVISLNTCGSAEDYKKFAATFLNDGALKKIDNQYKSLLEEGIKVSVKFAFSDTSNRKFDDKEGKLRISQHIEKCIRDYAVNNYFISGGVVNDYITFPQVAIPLFDNKTGKKVITNDFANIIRDYLENLKIEVKKVTVTAQSINFILN